MCGLGCILGIVVIVRVCVLFGLFLDKYVGIMIVYYISMCSFVLVKVYLLFYANCTLSERGG